MRIIDAMASYFNLCEVGTVDYDEDVIGEFMNAIYLLRRNPRNGV